MAINFGDVLSFTAGVAEKDMQYMQEKRNADFNLAMEEFKDNKALVTKLAENRYSRDVNKYDDEVKKYDAVKSVYSAISNDKLSPFDAAYRLASVMTRTGVSMIRQKELQLLRKIQKDLITLIILRKIDLKVYYQKVKTLVIKNHLVFNMIS